MKWLYAILAMVTVSHSFVVRACNASERKAIGKAYRNKVDTVVYLGCFEQGVRLFWEDSSFYVAPVVAVDSELGVDSLVTLDFKTNFYEDALVGVSITGDRLIMNKSGTVYAEKREYSDILYYMYKSDSSYTAMLNTDTLYHVELKNGKKYGFYITDDGNRVNGYAKEKDFIKDGENCQKLKFLSNCAGVDSVVGQTCVKFVDGVAVDKKRQWQNSVLVAVGSVDSIGNAHGWAKMRGCSGMWSYTCFIHGREYEPEACEGMKKPK